MNMTRRRHTASHRHTLTIPAITIQRQKFHSDVTQPTRSQKPSSSTTFFSSNRKFTITTTPPSPFATICKKHQINLSLNRNTGLHFAPTVNPTPLGSRPLPRHTPSPPCIPTPIPLYKARIQSPTRGAAAASVKSVRHAERRSKRQPNPPKKTRSQTHQKVERRLR